MDVRKKRTVRENENISKEQIKRDKTLFSLRTYQEKSRKREIGMFDFLFSFGGLC